VTQLVSLPVGRRGSWKLAQKRNSDIQYQEMSLDTGFDNGKRL
jgi:hypothetical protein